MSLPDQTPKLSKWFFLLSDVLLVAVAAFIATHSASPLGTIPILAIVGCVVVGAVVTAWAFIADYTRKQDEALDDRQRALEALARTVAASAEQISIATGSLHEIAELAQKNLRHAEHLPHKLQEKIAEFQAQLAGANDLEKEELEKELAELRASESERLESISDKIGKSAADWAKLEAATQKHLTAATEALAKVQTQAGAILDEKLSAALAALDSKIAASSALVERALALAAKAPPPAAFTPPPASDVATASAPDSAAAPESSATTITTAHPPKRPRKPRREESAAEEVPASAPPGESAPAAEPAPPSDIAAPLADEPPPIPVAKIPEIAPVVPLTAEPFTGHVGVPPAPEPGSAPIPETPDISEPAADLPKAAKKRASKKPATEPAADPALNLDITETPAAQSAEVVERVRTSDGATRLLVTAYIGIGNRLFIRGAGPGLSWEKGVPLQFVSIGKWRWETNDATGPVKFKLYKNDDTECAALGTQALEPGHQEEVTAAF